MFDIRIDTSSLTYTQFLIPEISSEFIEGANSSTISLEPGVYGFQQVSGVIANLRFEVTTEGLIEYDTAYEEFLSGRGTNTLTVRGFTVTLDARSLSHDLQPMIVGAIVLHRDLTHNLALVPAAGYSFLVASGIVADFRFDLDVNGQVVVDPRYSGFATVSGQTLTISGYQIMIDGRALSHDLLPLLLSVGNEGILTRDRLHELAYIPATGYSFLTASGIVADFRFDLDVSGQVVIDPRYGDFATASGRTLTINGYQVAIDGRQLSHDLVPLLLGNGDVLTRDRIHELTLVPASAYALMASGNPEIQFRITLNTNGEIAILDVPGGLIVMRPEPPPATLRSFYADFFLPARGSVREFCKPKEVLSLREAIRTHREGLIGSFSIRDLLLRNINNLFGGSTSEGEEDEALGILLGCTRAEDLIYLINKLTWDQLDDELDEGDLTQIMDRLKVLFDRRGYLIGFLLRWFFLVENERLPSIDFVNNSGSTLICV
jgi:hypothetical protein